MRDKVSQPPKIPEPRKIARKVPRPTSSCSERPKSQSVARLAAKWARSDENEDVS